MRGVLPPPEAPPVLPREDLSRRVQLLLQPPVRVGKEGASGWAQESLQRQQCSVSEAPLGCWLLASHGTTARCPIPCLRAGGQPLLPYHHGAARRRQVSHSVLELRCTPPPACACLPNCLPPSLPVTSHAFVHQLTARLASPALPCTALHCGRQVHPAAWRCAAAGHWCGVRRCKPSFRGGLGA